MFARPLSDSRGRFNYSSVATTAAKIAVCQYNVNILYAIAYYIFWYVYNVRQWVVNKISRRQRIRIYKPSKSHVETDYAPVRVHICVTVSVKTYVNTCVCNVYVCICVEIESYRETPRS